MVKHEFTARLASVYCGRSQSTDNPDTVIVRVLVNDRRDKDRPVLLELTSEGARRVAAQLLSAAGEQSSDREIIERALRQALEDGNADAVEALRKRL